tara:strand:- start:79 stop:348 length:270 start_codon:yes stop_codon:yes gene_type:complete
LNLKPEWLEARRLQWRLQMKIHQRITELMDSDETLQALLADELQASMALDGIRGMPQQDTIWEALDEETSVDIPYQEIEDGHVLCWERG